MRSGHGRRRAPRQWLRQFVTGVVALPLSALPFVAYATWTPEGRLVRDRAMVALRPPTLPTLDAAQKAAAVAGAPRYRDKVMALAYHGIGSASDGDGGFVVSPERFGEHLATLRAAGMRTVTAAQVARSFEGGRPLPPNAVMISFDDGRTDAMMFADPMLEQARMTATMFVITGAAEEPGVYYASWDKLEDYARSGRWDLQSHTADLHREREAAGGDHLPALTSLEPGESLAAYRTRVRTDLRRASAALERKVGRAPVAFAYPFGAYGADRTNHPAIREVLEEEVDRRYALAFHQDDQDTVPLAGRDDERLGLRRLEVGKWSGLDLLRRIRQAAHRTPGLEQGSSGSDTAVEPPPVPAEEPGTGTSPTTAPVTGPATTTPRRPSSPPTTAPSGRPPGTATTTVPTRPPGSTTTAPPGTTTTAPPPSTVPSTTTTVAPAPTTTTTVPPATSTTTTTRPRGCRSHGQGNVCPPP